MQNHMPQHGTYQLPWDSSSPFVVVSQHLFPVNEFANLYLHCNMKGEKIKHIWNFIHEIYICIYSLFLVTIHLSCLFRIFNKTIKTIVDNLEVFCELPLSRNEPSSWRKFPVRNVESRTMLGLKKCTIYCLKWVNKLLIIQSTG